MFGLLLTPPAELGFACFELPGYAITEVLGQGVHSVVYRLQHDGDQEESILKVFSDRGKCSREHDMLKYVRASLHESLQQHVPTIESRSDVMTLKEVISKVDYYGYVAKPLCVPIRPQLEGVMLSRSHVTQLLNVFRALHAANIFHGDIKPKNILIDNSSGQLLSTANVVICDWGSAMTAEDIENNVQRHSLGTIGYDDFSLHNRSSFPSAVNDLKALVRTVYANYTDQFVPSEDQQEANDFWTEHISEGSLWADAMEAAEKADHDGLLLIVLCLF